MNIHMIVTAGRLEVELKWEIFKKKLRKCIIVSPGMQWFYFLPVNWNYKLAGCLGERDVWKKAYFILGIKIDKNMITVWQKLGIVYISDHWTFDIA